MKANIIFDLPEDREELELCMQAGTMRACLDDILEYLRRLRKYDSVRIYEIDGTQMHAEIEAEIRTKLAERGIVSEM